MQVVAGSTSIELAKEIAELTSSKLIIPEFKTFPDGEQYIRFYDKFENDVLIIQSLFNPQAYHLFELLNMIYHIKGEGVQRLRVFTPYLCYARADRAVKEGEIVSAKTVLTMLENAGVDHLFVLDIHNPQVINETNLKVTNFFATTAIQNYFAELKIELAQFQIVAPDEGAEARARIYGEALNIDYTWLEKKRDPVTGEISVDIGKASIISDKVIIIDDIMSSGSSIERTASLLKLYGVQKIYVFVTHALGTSLVDKIRDLGEGEVIATISIPTIIGSLSPAIDLVNIL